MTAGYKWKPLRRAAALPASEALVAVWMKHHGTMDRAEVLRLMAEEQARVELWRNDPRARLAALPADQERTGGAGMRGDRTLPCRKPADRHVEQVSYLGVDRPDVPLSFRLREA
jgi:hypothetical protein